MTVDRRACRLDDEHVRPANIFLDLQIGFAVSELPDHRAADFDSEILANLVSQRGVGIRSEDREAVVTHGAYRLWGGHILSAMCSFRARHHIAR